MEIKHIPEIRFKGFSGEWEEKFFKELTKRVSSGCKDKILPRIEFEDINSGLGTLNKDIYEKDNKEKSGIHFKDGYILFGKLRPYLKNWFLASFEGVAVGDFWVLEPKLDTNSKFLYNLIQSEKFEKISNLSLGTKMPRSDWGVVSNTIFSIPKINEQEKIGQLFESIDNMIEAQRKLIEENKKLKKSLLQKMFPKKGENIPELRLKGFSEKWEEKRLENILTERKELSIPSKSYPLVSFTVKDGVTPKTERYEREFLVRGIDKKYKITKLNDLVYNPANLKFGAISLNKYGNAVFSPIYVTYNINMNYDTDFIGLNFTRIDFINNALKYQEGTVYERQAVKSQDLLILKTKIPSLKEQEAIGKLFKSFDEKIENEEKKLENYKNLKKSLLQKMFI